MKLIILPALLGIALFGMLGCGNAEVHADASPPNNDHSFKQATQEAKQQAVEAANTQLQRDPAASKIRIETDDASVKYFRQHQLVLQLPPHNPDYYQLWGPNGAIGNVITNNTDAPRITIRPNLSSVTFIKTLSKDKLLLEVYNPKTGYTERYILTSKSVEPVSAEQYLKFVAKSQASKACFKSIYDSLMKGAAEHD